MITITKDDIEQGAPNQPSRLEIKRKIVQVQDLQVNDHLTGTGRVVTRRPTRGPNTPARKVSLGVRPANSPENESYNVQWIATARVEILR